MTYVFAYTIPLFSVAQSPSGLDSSPLDFILVHRTEQTWVIQLRRTAWKVT